MKIIQFGPEIITSRIDEELKFLSIFKMPTIIGFTGPTKSGKTTIAKRLVTSYNFQYINLSSIIQEHLRYTGKKGRSWLTLGQEAERIRNEYGLDYFARNCYSRVRKSILIGDRIVIDGLLHPAEILFFRKFAHFQVIGVDASEEIRCSQAQKWYPQSYASPKEIKDRDTYEQVYQQRENASMSPNVMKCLEQVDHYVTIENEFNDRIFVKTDNIIETILNNY